jgi:hypothetical protein
LTHLPNQLISQYFNEEEEVTLKRAIILALVFVVFLPLTAAAQTRKRTSRKAAPVASKPQPSTAVHDGALEVANQIKNLTRFIYVLGGVAKGIEQTEVAVRRNEASPAIVSQLQKDKATVKQSLQSVREGLDRLEIRFRSSPELNRYYTNLVGSAAGAATAEDDAAAGHLDKAGRSLLAVVNRLTDVLLEMK